MSCDSRLKTLYSDLSFDSENNEQRKEEMKKKKKKKHIPFSMVEKN